MANDMKIMPSMAMDDGSDEEEESAHSAISNESDFDGDEEIEYLAMELVNHLPAEQASRLLKNMRQKEKAVQDLLHRNRFLLNSCKELDSENQALSDKLKESETAATAPAPAPAAVAATETSSAAAAPAPSSSSSNVDTSYFLKLEQGKEEKILLLQRECERLAIQLKRTDDINRQIYPALEQAKKEIRKLQTQVRMRTPQAGEPAPRPRGAPSSGELQEEEERLYRELEDKRRHEDLVVRAQLQEEEHRKQMNTAVKALANEELTRTKRWCSDVAALMLAVDGIEAGGKSGNKSTTKKSKGTSAAGATIAERLAAFQVQLTNDFQELQTLSETMDEAHGALEKTTGSIRSGADAIAAALPSLPSMEKAEDQASKLTEALGKLASALTAGPMLELFGQLQASLDTILLDAPPGLLPPKAEQGLHDARAQILQLCEKLETEVKAVSSLQDTTTSHLGNLKAAHKSLKVEMQNRAAEQFNRSLTSLRQPTEALKDSLQKQSEAIAEANARAFREMEELSSLGKRISANPDAAESATLGVREVRSMGRALLSSLEEGVKVLEHRVSDVFLEMKEEGNKKGVAVNNPVQKDGQAEAGKKKKNAKKKGKPSPSPPPEPERTPSEPTASHSTKVTAPHTVLDNGDEPEEVPRGHRSGSKMSGAELMLELEAQNKEAESLKARMASRRAGGGSSSAADATAEEWTKDAAQGPPGEEALSKVDEFVDAIEDEELAAAASKPAPKARRKKMFV
mmetsp:Transcript_11098/g.24467  ORF Transcript_11098/g.24467 Transcript_11098/m.24467 type:complete len:744 (-) Transcript_11098:364-2595(-)|eukprot:CAMPEP_0206451204 /NCGR_PEP_ID=MMETSP0324_2-20121206/19195_1 /ASSEMBLY_ACC=CAM_ASM_000836 /TAXON_ID=2866 /ORGANISM="Crypthecodinium cohnii, Strain Seligo" /LENGTH=743 /DNA_ID=CAMNT_0053921027 /DNA_START=176 /DNA_END=2407 /DNA_ORIENTATION=-